MMESQSPDSPVSKEEPLTLKITPILHAKKRVESDTQRITITAAVPESRSDSPTSRIPLIGASARLRQ